MELMPGYKHSDVGVIPKDWDVRTLAELCLRITDGTHDTPTPVRSGVPFLTAIHIKENFIDYETCLYLTAEEHNLIFARCNPERGDVLIVNIGAGVATTALIDVDFEFSLKNVALLKTNVLIASGEYLNQYLIKRKPSITQTLSSGGAQPFLSLSQIGQIRIAVPSIFEQKNISQTLSDVDALLATLSQMISKKRDVKQATMQKLLTGKTRLPGFSGEWEVRFVKDFGEIVTGGTPSTENKEFWGEGYPWITPTDIATERDMITSERTITHEGLGAIRLLPANTVLVTCIASIGKNAILRSVGGCNQQINAIIPNNDNCAEFIYFLMEANKQYLLSNAGTTATAILSKFTFSEMEFLVPLKPEQTAIAAVLSGMDAEISVLEARRDKTRNIKQGMMQELLTGKTRLLQRGLND